jgi:signal transduction histidine kinase
VSVSCGPEHGSGLRGGAPAVRLTVADDGPGVPAAERARIFERFYRAPGTRARGSGIGLSLVARIAEMHGASIEIGAGLDGRGLAVSVCFAQAQAAQPLQAPAASPHAVGGGRLVGVSEG